MAQNQKTEERSQKTKIKKAEKKCVCFASLTLCRMIITHTCTNCKYLFKNSLFFIIKFENSLPFWIILIKKKKIIYTGRVSTTKKQRFPLSKAPLSKLYKHCALVYNITIIISGAC
ncbi:MAG: hypothetical protein LBS36_07410 [Oscillospiraceae bacterium]|nr:hypothetical protein [Oscillospiraceae bacterium]